MSTELGECPQCGLIIMRWKKGPHGLAVHQCEPEEESMGMVLSAASSPELTLEEAAMAGARVMLWQAARGEKFDARGYGDLLAGVAKLKESGGDGADAALKMFMNMEESEE